MKLNNQIITAKLYIKIRYSKAFSPSEESWADFGKIRKKLENLGTLSVVFWVISDFSGEDGSELSGYLFTDNTLGSQGGVDV